MAEFKTAEQYVVEKVEMLERELDQAELTHKIELEEVMTNLEATKDELTEAYQLLNMFRDFIEVRKNNYFRNTICVDNIYEKEHPEIVARIMEYYDLRTDEEDSDE